MRQETILTKPVHLLARDLLGHGLSLQRRRKGHVLVLVRDLGQLRATAPDLGQEPEGVLQRDKGPVGNKGHGMRYIKRQRGLLGLYDCSVAASWANDSPFSDTGRGLRFSLSWWHAFSHCGIPTWARAWTRYIRASNSGAKLPTRGQRGRT